MTGRCAWRCVCVLLSVLWPAIATAQDALETFEQHFGRQLRQVTSTANPDDDVQLAGRLLEAARAAQERPELAALLCERAYELTAGYALGYETAMRAMQLLAERLPARRSEALSRAASMGQRLFRRAPPDQRASVGRQLVDILAQLAEDHRRDRQWQAAILLYTEAIDTAEQIGSDRRRPLTAERHRTQVMADVDRLTSRLRADPTDHQAADLLMRLYTVELDDPEQARRHHFTADDRELKEHVRLAARDPQNLSDDELMALGDWYAGLVHQASPWAAPAMRARARRYYRLLLRRPLIDDAVRQRADAALRLLGNGPQAEETVTADAAPPPAPTTAPDTTPAEPAPPSPEPETVTATDPPPRPQSTDPPPAEDGDGRIDLLRGVDPSTHGVRGQWAFEDDDLLGRQPTPAQLILPTVPDGDYTIEVRFTRTSAVGAVALHLPVGQRNVLLKLGERRRRLRDHIAGLSMVGGEPAQSNPTTTPLELESDRTYRVLAEVKTAAGGRATVRITLDGEPLLSWEGSASSLSVAEAWDRLNPKALGLGVDNGGVIRFHSVRLLMLSGQAAPL